MASIYDLLYTQPIQQTAPQPNEAPPPLPVPPQMQGVTPVAQAAPAPVPQAVATVPPAPPPEVPPVKEVVAEKTFQEKMGDPAFAQPLQTFLAALSVPLSPWETIASRLGRSAMMMNMHRDMLTENARLEPMKREKEQLELDRARLEVEGSREDLTAARDTNAFNAETKGTRVAALEQALQNAITTGDTAKEELTMKKLEVLLKQKYGAQAAEAELNRLRADTDRMRASAFRDRAGAVSDRTAAESGDKVFNRQVQAADALVRGRLNQFRQTNPTGTKKDFYAWLGGQADYDPNIGDVYTAVGMLEQQGRDPFNAMATAPTAAGNAPISAAAIRAAMGGDKSPVPAPAPRSQPAPVAQPVKPTVYEPYAEGQARKQANATAIAALNTALAAKGVEMQRAQARADTVTMQRLQGELAGITQRIQALSK